MIATTKESAPGPGPDGIPYGIHRCAGGLGSSIYDAYKCVLEGGAVPTHCAASRTIFIPKSSTVDDNGIRPHLSMASRFGLIVRSPVALRPLTLCNCE